MNLNSYQSLRSNQPEINYNSTIIFGTYQNLHYAVKFIFLLLEDICNLVDFYFLIIEAMRVKIF